MSYLNDAVVLAYLSAGLTLAIALALLVIAHCVVYGIGRVDAQHYEVGPDTRAVVVPMERREAA